MVLRIIIFILLMAKILQTKASGFDAYSSCYRTSRKRQELPCDFGSQTWCTIPGSSYPWHAVRRFVHENQGLMRRMYGDERHISVLRAELESNDIEYFSSPIVKEEFRRRYSKDMDGTRDFVKMFVSNEGRKLINNPMTEKVTKIEKIQKSIEEKSNNVYQNHIKNTKVEELKNAFGQALSNKTLSKTTTTSPVTTSTFVVEAPEIMTTNSESTANQTTEPTNSTAAFPALATDTTIQPITKQDGVHHNSTKPVPLANNTYYEDLDYDSETEETLTTTSLDSLTTTEFEEVEEIAKDKDDYEESVEEVEVDEKATAEESVSPQPLPMIRLKGINACPVKEEVVAPFWANNTRGEVLALLNLYPFEQYVHWEKCTYEHKQMFCREGCRCEQQYRLHRLLAYDPNNECRGIFSDWFRFPSCCVCKCYDLPVEFRLTSRSPRFRNFNVYENLFSPKKNP